MNYSKFNSIDYDSDEELCRPPEKSDRHGFRSVIQQRERQGDAHRREYICNMAVHVEKEREKELQSLGANQERSTKDCWTCHSPDATLRCGRCKQVFFCSRECQQNGWKAHKFQCRETTEAQAKAAEKADEWREMLARRAKHEELEYGPKGELGPVQKIMLEDAKQQGLHRPPVREGGDLSIAVVVPFRQQQPLQERGAHLRQLVTCLHSSFTQLVKGRWIKAWKLLIVQQANDGRPFNRGALLDAGFHFLEESGDDFENVVFHDVDLLPDSSNSTVWYAADIPPGYILHNAAEGYAKYAHTSKCHGAVPGVVTVKRDDFKKSRGFPLDIWGWADKLEDKVWMDRLGKVGIRCFPCPVGLWKDLDRVDLRMCQEAMDDPVRHYDEKWFRWNLPEEPVEPRGPGGQILPGPAALPDMTQEERYTQMATRHGGVDTADFYKVLSQESCLVHATRIEVLINPVVHGDG